MTSSERQPSIRLDIFADPVCPWCHVGKLNLYRALAEVPMHPFHIEWHPFRLNPDMPVEGVDKREWLEAKLGGKERVDAVHDRLRQAAAEVGVELDPDRPKVLPNTLDAHRLIHWAGLEGVQSDVVTGIYQAYWDEGRDIGQPGVLADIGAKAGMDRNAILRLLASDADRDDLIARDEDAREKGVTSVPTFLIAQHYVVAGAQTPAFWAEVIGDILAGDSNS